ncbi:Serine racemase, partial [Globisporangium splendens]
MQTQDAGEKTYAISLASIEQAAQRIQGLAHRTPVLTCHTLDALASDARGASEQQSVRLFFKCENLQKIGAFKYRGALNAVRKYQEQHQDGGNVPTFVTHSSGNHAQAVALAAKDTQSKAIIVMPNNAPAVKVNAVRGYGAEVVLCEPTGEAREAEAQRCADASNGYLIHPSDDVDVMSGQGTAALELLAQVQEQYSVTLDAVVVPIGGGGLCSGVAMATKSLSKDTKVFAAEPTGAADAYRSFSSGELSGHNAPPNTVADGLKTTLGDNNWPVIRDFVDDIVLVSDEEIVSTMKLMWERMKLVVEPSGAVAAAAVLTNKSPLNNSDETNGIKNIGIVISGGNIDLDRLPWLPMS